MYEDPELLDRYPGLSDWVYTFFHQDWKDEYPDAAGAVMHSLVYFAGDRRRCVDDIRRFRSDLPTSEARLAAIRGMGSYYNDDPAEFMQALDLLEEKFLEEIETGVSYRDVLDDEGD